MGLEVLSVILRWFSVRLLLFSSALLVSLSACSSGGDASPTAPRVPSSAQVEFDSFNLVNGARSQNSVDPQLELRETLTRVAREHSRAMWEQNFFSHRDPQGRTVGERLGEAGITFRVAAENLARTTNIPDPATWAHDQLMQSTEHRPNILNPDFELVGVGVVEWDGTYWITQVFVGF